MNFVQRKKKEISIFKSRKTFLRLGYFQWVSRIRGNKNILFLALLCLQFLFMNTVLARIFWGFMLRDNTVYLLPCPWIVSSETLFSWPYLQECRFSLHNARPTLKNFCFPIPDIIKKRRVSGICYF